MATLTGTALLITILVIAAGTILTRALPFWIFPPGKQAPAFVRRLENLLPSAVIGLLLVYCLRYVDIFAGSRGLPEALAVAATAALHLWRRSTLISIAGGTALYMALVQHVF
ncbi:MAG: AzlD domain-containing protein [Oscillospiraceae bacterium]|nr:AzlD domain-containing protein [Oscillospiraceae bacterium]